MRIPLSGEEVNNLITIKYEGDELHAIKTVEKGCSVSGKIFQRAGSTRHIIRQALSSLAQCREEQATLRGIICATRFEYAQLSAEDAGSRTRFCTW